jgi:subtilisin family serine protease
MSPVSDPCLDPRLRRIVQTQADPRHLRRDLGRALTAASEADAANPTADTALARVLVMLAGDERPAGFAQHRWIMISDRIYSVELPVSELEALAAAPEVKYVEAGRRLAPVLDSSVPETRADQVHQPAPPDVGFDGSDVIVGVIDFGLDFTMDDFRHPDGTTRVLALWDQTLEARAGEQAPAGFGFGVEYDEARINQALQAANPFTIVRHEPEPGSHGTHVASTAAGNGRSHDNTFPANRFIGTAPGAGIIFVQPAANDQATTFTDSVHVAEAVAYIFQKAAALGRPCVINMSLGQNGGSHDGESIVERAIDRLLDLPGRAMTVAAGNEHVWRGHAAGQLAVGVPRRLRWKVGGGLPVGGGMLPARPDRTTNEMEVWLSSRDRVSVRVIDPQGSATPVVAPGSSLLHSLPSGDEVFIDSERFTVLNGDARIYIELGLGNDARVTSGEWQVELVAEAAPEGRFDAWIERDFRDPDNRFGDQSFFVGSDFDGLMTLGTPATPRRALAVANYDHRAQAPNSSSGRGRTRDGRAKPEVAAPGTDIVAAHALGGRPDGNGGVHPMRVDMSGTSMAAPHVAGIVALMLQKNGALTAEQSRAILIAAARPPAGVTPFDVAWGYGKVDAKAAVDLVAPGSGLPS